MNISEVVQQGLCTQCGACVATCPKGHIALERDEYQNFCPRVIAPEECRQCNLCLQVCPGLEANYDELNRFVFSHLPEDTLLGNYQATYLGYSGRERIRQKSSSGGIVTSLLEYMLDIGAVDGALVVREGNRGPFNPDIFIARNQVDLYSAMQSKYFPVPILSGLNLNSLLKRKERLAVVGLPCHIHGIRKMEQLFPVLQESIRLHIGLFCGLNTNFCGMHHLISKAGIHDIEQIKEIRYRDGDWPGKIAITLTSGKRYSLPLQEKNFVNYFYILPRCTLCMDQTNELADISVGDAWLPECSQDNKGWSVCLARTQAGYKIISEAQDKGYVILNTISPSKIIESQKPMLMFKKKAIYARLRINRFFGNRAIPEITSRKFSDPDVFDYIGALFLRLNISVAKYKFIRMLISHIPSKLLGLYFKGLAVLMCGYRTNKMRPMKQFRRIAYGGVRLLRRLKGKRAAKAISKVKLSQSLKEPIGVQEFLRSLRSRKEPVFFFDESDIKRFKLNPVEKDKILKDADSICNREIELLGSGRGNIDVQPGRIDWHKDFKNNESWDPRVFYTDTVLVKGNGSDILIPWELSRFQHLPTLGKAYWLTKDEKYAREFVNEIDDWINNNPPQYGVNWTCTMEVAIRAVNWLWGYYFFKDSPEVTNEFLLKFVESLLVQGHHVMANLERLPGWLEFLYSLIINRLPVKTSLQRSRRGVNNNHYLSDLVGLVYLGVMFPEFKEAEKWRDFGIKGLIDEMAKQVYSDGVVYEGSINYHRLVTEFFLSSTLLCFRNGINFPQWYMKKLEKMIEFVMYYTKPDGISPQIGDNDDGRLHILSDYGDWDRHDHRYLLSIGAALFGNPAFKQATDKFHEEAFWLLGEEGLSKRNSLPAMREGASSKDFSPSGFYIMRKDELYIMVDCVSNDLKAPSGHRHNSRLSFELFAHDKSFIIDPGGYTYTGDKEMRNLFRSTRYHNTVVIDDKEQNEFDEAGLFEMAYQAKVKVNHWEVKKEYDLLDVEHNGYERLKYPVTHQRQIFFDKVNGCWIVRDILSGKGRHQVALYFHFAPMELELEHDYPLAVKTRTEGSNIVIIPLEKQGISVEIIDGWVSYRYGVKQRAPIVKYSQNSAVPCSFCNIIYPYQGEVEVGKVVSVMSGVLDKIFNN